MFLTVTWKPSGQVRTYEGDHKHINAMISYISDLVNQGCADVSVKMTVSETKPVVIKYASEIPIGTVFNGTIQIFNSDFDGPWLKLDGHMVNLRTYCLQGCGRRNGQTVLVRGYELQQRYTDEIKAMIPKFFVSTEHCEICGKQEKRLQYHRCPEHNQ